jgi:hypothetical protein
VHSHKC